MDTTSGGVRKLPCIVSAFCEWLEPCDAPAAFKRWAGIALVAGALERRVWAWGRGYRIHPNIFALLIGPPGSGKTAVIDPVAKIWAKVAKFNIIPSSATRSAFISDIIKAPNPKMVLVDGKVEQTNPGLMALAEFGHFFRENDLEIMNLLNAFYDANDRPYIDSTISSGIRQIDRPSLSLLAGTQPNYLHKILPDESFKMGFATRLIMHYEGSLPATEIFGVNQRPDDRLELDIIHDLGILSTLAGEYHFERSAALMLNDWFLKGQKPRPTHIKLQDYNTRRWASIFKLSMSLTASRTQERLIKKETVEEAMTFLFAAEETLPDAFSGMGAAGDTIYMEETWNWAMSHYQQAPMREALITQFLVGKVQAYRVKPIIDMMVSVGMIKVVGNAQFAGARLMEPREQSEWSIRLET